MECEKSSPNTLPHEEGNADIGTNGGKRGSAITSTSLFVSTPPPHSGFHLHRCYCSLRDLQRLRINVCLKAVTVGVHLYIGNVCGGRGSDTILVRSDH